MKILFITNNFPFVIDGVGDYTYHLCKEFVKHHHEVAVITSDKAEIKSKNKELEKDIILRPIVKKWTFKTVFLIWKEVQNFKPDWISIQYVPYSFHPYGLAFNILFLVFYLKLRKQKVQVTFHEIATGFYSIDPVKTFISLFQRFASWSIAFLSDFSVTSTGMYSRMIKWIKPETYIIHIGSNFPDIYSENDNKVEAKEFIITSFSNRITGELLKSIHNLKESGYAVKLVGIGKNDKKNDEFIHEITNTWSLQSEVELKGVLDEQSILKAMKESIIHLQIEPLDKNKNGGVALKSGTLAVALSLGKVVVTVKGKMTDTDLLIDHQHLVYTEPDAENITKTIKYLLDNPDKMKYIRKESRKFYEEKLSWDVIAEEYLKYFEKYSQ